ncbi:MAG TPA: hypothetical protein DEU95_01550 [Chloroflexi bacterium]|nr:hypothetical protein [Chloroflexota bacterium]
MFDGGTPILTLMLAVIGGAALVDVVRNRQALFDDRLTMDERQRLTRLALFVLVPLSVILHELGHAVMVKAFGGQIVGWGFYLYYGYVEHTGYYTPIQLAWIAVAGTVVNVVLGLGAIAWAWFRPGNVAVRYLLFVFGAFSLLNSLVFYPLLDALGGISGDWETIYSRQTPIFSAVIGLLHATILIGGVALWRNTSIRAGYERRTGLRRETAVFAGPQPERQPDGSQRELAGVLAVAAAAASNGWRHPVTIATDDQSGGAQVVVRWASGGFQRALLVHAAPDGNHTRVELHAAVQALEPSSHPFQRQLARVDGIPTTEELTPYIRRFLDYVDTWDGATITTPN